MTFELYDLLWPYRPFHCTFASLTFQGHPRSKVMAQSESPYMISYLSVINSEALSFTVFEIMAKNVIFDRERSKVKLVYGRL